MHDEQDFSVTLADTGLDTMTGGRVKRIEKYVDGDTFLLTYGDGVSRCQHRGRCWRFTRATARWPP